MPVQDLHQDYLANIERWKKTRAAVKGKDAVLEMSREVLPLTQNNNDPEMTEANLERYADYSYRAHYYNATGRTKRGLLGLVKSKPSNIKTHDGLEYLVDNANGAGVGLLQQSIKSASDVLEVGRSGLLVSYPVVDGQITLAEKEKRGIFARIIRVKPENIINWKTETFGSEVRLSLLVIREAYEKKKDKFTSHIRDQFRVLEIVSGQCFVEIHKPGEDGENKVEGPYPLKDSSGKVLDFIPFQFIGAENNDHEVDDAPLYDLAETNLAHFRNSADFEEAAHLAKELTLVISGLTDDWYKDHLKGTISVGTRSALVLNVGATAEMLQPAETMMAERGMTQKEANMVALGAQLIDRGVSIKTATQANHDASAEHSQLSMVTENVSSAYLTALDWAALMEGSTGDNEFNLPNEFVTDQLDAQMLTALVSSWQQGGITTEAKNNKLRRAGIERHDKTDDEIAEEIEQSTSFLDDDR